MDFLVFLTVTFPACLDDDVIEGLVRAERVRGRELRASGALRQIWRVSAPEVEAEVTQLSNVGLWSAGDRQQLDGLLSSLPLWPFARADILAVQQHPLDMPDQ